MQNDSTIQHLISLRDEFYRKYKSIDETISLLTDDKQLKIKDLSIHSTKNDGYDKKWSMKNKLSHVLKIEGKFLHIRQIAERLHKYEPGVSEKDFISKLYPAIALLKKSTIVKFSADKTNLNSFWGSKNWLDDNGKIKEGYMYDADQIKNNKSEEIEI